MKNQIAAGPYLSVIVRDSLNKTITYHNVVEAEILSNGSFALQAGDAEGKIVSGLVVTAALYKTIYWGLQESFDPDVVPGFYWGEET